MSQSDVKKVSDTFRKSALGVRLGRVLFDPSLQFKLNPSNLTNIFRQLGVPIPKEAAISLQTAQMLMSGGAFVSSISNANSILQITKSGASTISAAMGLMQLAGLLDANSIFCRTVQMGVDASLVISSGGTNVLADIALVMDVVTAAVFPPDERPMVANALDRLNYNNYKTWYLSRKREQSQSAVDLVKSYQNKQISIFEFIGEFALQSGDNFPNYFPEYKVFLPPRVLDQIFMSEEEANYGGFLFIGRKTENVRRSLIYSFETVSGYSGYDVAKAFVKKFVTDPFSPYLILGLGSIPFSDLALLSVMSDDFETLPNDFDVVPTLQKLLLTPKDILGRSITDFQFSKNEQYETSGITINGVDQLLSASQRAKNESISFDTYAAKIAQNAEAQGDIYTLAKIPKVREALKQWATIPDLTPQQLSVLPNSYFNVTNSGLNLEYKNLQNYFGVLSVINYMKQDRWLQQNFVGDIFRSLEYYFPSTEKFQEKYDNLLNLSTARYLNIQARQNVAAYFQTTAEKVEFKNHEDGTAYVVPKGK